jgi:transcriptional regulator
MYIPKFNEETRPEVMQGLIASHPLATLITLGGSGLFASHLPMLFEPRDSTENGPYGTLRGHLARGNQQWKDFSSDVDALAIFAGPEHYITPSWYPEKAQDGKVVPTWNYAVVHAYGPLRIIEDAAWLLAHVRALTELHEGSFAQPWSVDDAPTEYVTGLTRGIVGVELPVRRIEGKWKVSQNKSQETRKSIERGLSELDSPSALAMSALVNGERG